MNQFKQREDSSSPLPGAAYIRFSSEMQSDSFSLDAQLRQIKEQAERDHVTIVKVNSDPAKSAYRKKFRPGINAMRETLFMGDNPRKNQKPPLRRFWRGGRDSNPRLSQPQHSLSRRAQSATLAPPRRSSALHFTIPV